jgi:hypothetical protein
VRLRVPLLEVLVPFFVVREPGRLAIVRSMPTPEPLFALPSSGVLPSVKAEHLADSYKQGSDS